MPQGVAFADPISGRAVAQGHGTTDAIIGEAQPAVEGETADVVGANGRVDCREALSSAARRVAANRRDPAPFCTCTTRAKMPMSPTPSGMSSDRVSEQVDGALAQFVTAGHLAHDAALRPATQGGKSAPTPRPAPMPQAPLRCQSAWKRGLSAASVQVVAAAGEQGHIS